jgi:hypothetical protein
MTAKYKLVAVLATPWKRVKGRVFVVCEKLYVLFSYGRERKTISLTFKCLGTNSIQLAVVRPWRSRPSFTGAMYSLPGT